MAAQPTTGASAGIVSACCGSARGRRSRDRRSGGAGAAAAGVAGCWLVGRVADDALQVAPQGAWTRSGVTCSPSGRCKKGSSRSIEPSICKGTVDVELAS